jgi:colicin import membrane protein
MHATADQLDFAPPPQSHHMPALVFALLAHVMLLLALTWGITWKRESEDVVAEAELWSSVPEPAAPRLVQAPPPSPALEQKIAPAPAPAAPSQADIALERELKKKQEQAEHRREELERQKKLHALQEQEALKREELAQKKAAEARQKLEEQAKAAKLRAKQRDEDKKLAALREEQLRRLQGLAGATGNPAAAGTAQKSTGPSDSYAGRIRGRVKPNIVFTDEIGGNPTTEVEVQLAPDGTIISRKITKSSGAESWDEAVLRALDKTEVLPRDVDGRIHTPLLISFRPKD